MQHDLDNYAEEVKTLTHTNKIKDRGKSRTCISRHSSVMSESGDQQIEVGVSLFYCSLGEISVCLILWLGVIHFFLTNFGSCR